MRTAGIVIGYISSFDFQLMRWVGRWDPPRWVRIWMLLATRGGDGWLWYALGLAVFTFGGPSRRAALAAAALSSATGVMLFVQLKRLIRRPRPCALQVHCWAELLPPDQFSFPSGHSITAFAVVIPIGTVYPDLMAGLLFCALSVAASRILLGMHYLSDVAAGSLIGILLGCAGCACVL